MLTRALLMCSDAKSLEAVGQILGELEISFETVPDAALAAKRLANQRFDPILVDCDNVSNATLVLESARKSSANQSSMTIAIVDGKAGVPTAFRLGARLVMTKPVSLEGARSTLRNALAMQRKEAHDGKASAAAAAHGSSAAIAPIQDANLGQKTVEDAPRAASPSRPSTPTAPHSLPSAESATVRPSNPAKMGSVPATASAPVKAPGSTEGATNVVPLSLSRTEHGSIEIDDATATQWDQHPGTRRSSASPSFSTRERRQRKTSPYLLTAVVMLLVAAGFYAAFTMLPTFHEMVLSQYDNLHTLITGTPAKAQAGVASPRPAPGPAQPVTAPTAIPASAQPSNAAAATAASSTSSNTVADGFAPAQAAPTQGFKGDDTKTKAASVLLPTSATAPKGNSDKRVVVAEDIADAHVSYRVRPVYPYAARRKGVEGAVVLLASVNLDGTVDSVRVINGNPQLAPSAVEAVKQWRYEPYYANGQPVVFQTQVTVRFQTSSR